MGGGRLAAAAACGLAELPAPPLEEGDGEGDAPLLFRAAIDPIAAAPSAPLSSAIAMENHASASSKRLRVCARTS